MSRRRRTGSALLALAGVALLAGCEVAPPGDPQASGPPGTGMGTALAAPAIRIDPSWTAVDGAWTFTGQLDPQGDPTDVVFEVGPGPATLRRFDSRLEVASQVADAGPVTITIDEVPAIDEVCVRFAATNSGGSSFSIPLCFDPRPRTPQAGGAPSVTMDQEAASAADGWTFSGRVDPHGAPTDVVLEIGPGPAGEPLFDRQVAAAQALTEAAKLEITTQDVPEADEVCVRFRATNQHGTTASEALCIDPSAGAS